MRKVNAIVLYKRSTGQIYTLTANHNGNLIPLVRYNIGESPEPYKYSDYQDMYTSVLRILHQNNMYVGKYSEFGADWYDIMWIDMENPVHVDKFSYHRGKEYLRKTKGTLREV